MPKCKMNVHIVCQTVLEEEQSKENEYEMENSSEIKFERNDYCFQ